MSKIINYMENEINMENSTEQLGKMALTILKYELALNIIDTVLHIDKQFYCYGTGTFAKRFFLKNPTLFEKVTCFIDSDLNKEGKAFLGKPIVHINNVILNEKECILILSSFNNEIEKLLVNKGYLENEQFFSISQIALWFLIGVK